MEHRKVQGTWWLLVYYVATDFDFEHPNSFDIVMIKLQVSSNEIALMKLRQGITVWQEIMNPIVIEKAMQIWGEGGWFEKCKSCLSPTCQKTTNQGNEFDAYRISTICASFPKELFPTLPDDMSREAHRFSDMLVEEFTYPCFVVSFVFRNNPICLCTRSMLISILQQKWAFLRSFPSK